MGVFNVPGVDARCNVGFWTGKRLKKEVEICLVRELAPLKRCSWGMHSL